MQMSMPPSQLPALQVPAVAQQANLWEQYALAGQFKMKLVKIECLQKRCTLLETAKRFENNLAITY